MPDLKPSGTGRYESRSIAVEKAVWLVARKGKEQAAARDVPDPGVPSGRDESPPIRTEGQPEHLGRVTLQDALILTAGQVEQANSLRSVHQGQHSAVGTERHALGLEPVQFLAAGHVPQLHFTNTLLRSDLRSQQLTIRTKRDAEGPARAFHDPRFPVAGQLIEFNGLLTTCGQDRPIRTKREGIDHV